MKKNAEEKIKKNAHKPTVKQIFTSRSSKAGGFSLILMAVVLVLVIVVNAIATALPEKFSSFDLTNQKSYTIGEQSQKLLDSLKKDVTIYYIFSDKGDSDKDPNIEKMLKDYAEKSEHIKLETVDHYKDPALVAKYTSIDLENNSAIVVCGDEYKVVYYSSMVDYDPQTYQYYGQLQVIGYKTENAVTNAIDAVINSNTPVIRMLTGHGESELDSQIVTYLEFADFKQESLNLLNTAEIPADTGCVAVINPTKDFSESDTETVKKYMENGGKLFLMTDSVSEKDFPNLTALLKDNGILPTEGKVVETDTGCIGNSSGFDLILTTHYDHEIVNNDLADVYISTINSNAQGFTLAEDASCAPIIGTSDNAYLTNDGEKEDAEKQAYYFGCTADVGESGSMVYYSTASLVDSTVYRQTPGNIYLVLNSFSSLCGKESTYNIPSVEITGEYLTMSSTAAIIFLIAFLLLIPGGILLAGIVVVIVRRKH